MKLLSDYVITDTMNLVNSTTSTLEQITESFVAFIPSFISGLIILGIGLLVASLIKSLIIKLSAALKLEKWLKKAHLENTTNEETWVNIVATIAYWFIVLSFLVAAFNAWNIPALTDIVNQLIAYIPNVLAAVVIGFIGLLFSGLAYNIVSEASLGLGKRNSNLLANLAKYSIWVFSAILVLNQLKISPNLIQTLLSGFVFMIALAGGLAFGLGGQDTVKRLLDRYIK